MEGLSIFKDYFNRVKREIILNNYYTKEVKDGKSMRASFIDWIFVTIVTALFFFITIFNTTKRIAMSVMLTGVLMFIYLFLFINWKQRTRIKNITRINKKMGNKEVLKEIAKYSNRDFMAYLKALLEKYYETAFFEYDNHIDFIGEINGEIYGVKCFKNSLDNRVTMKDIENYITEMKKKNIQEGILVTNSYFSDEVKEQTNFLLIDFDQIIQMLIKTGQYPSREEIEEIIIAKYEDKKGHLKESLSLNRKDKIYKFILLGIVLYIVSSFVSYSLYYRVMAYVSIFTGVIIGAYNLVEYLKRATENRI